MAIFWTRVMWSYGVMVTEKKTVATWTNMVVHHGSSKWVREDEIQDWTGGSPITAGWSWKMRFKWGNQLKSNFITHFYDLSTWFYDFGWFLTSDVRRVGTMDDNPRGKKPPTLPKSIQVNASYLAMFFFTLDLSHHRPRHEKNSQVNHNWRRAWHFFWVSLLDCSWMTWTCGSS